MNIYAVLVFLGGLTGVLTLFYILIGKRYEREKEKLREELKSALATFIEAPDEQTPSALAVLVDQGATLMASRLIQQIKAMWAGMESGLAKAENTEQTRELLEAAPGWVGMVANLIPKRLQRRLLKNPQMIGSLGKIMGEHNDGATRETVGNRLKRQGGG